jgi:hypothetical protein
LKAWVGSVASSGWAAVALPLLRSPGFRGLQVSRLYVHLLNRTAPADADVSGWVGTGLDLLSIEVFFAASPEFQANG